MTRSTARPTARLVTALAGVAALLGALAAPSAAAPVKKLFHESLSAPVLLLGQQGRLAFTLTNDPGSSQSFASAEIVVPNGFTVTGDPSTSVAGFTAVPTTVTGLAVVLVKSAGSSAAGIQAGASLVVTVPVTPARGGCAVAWPTYVKQSNDFSGSGNDFTPADPAPTTTVGQDTLAFTTQPSTTQYATTMAPAPVVTVYDPCGHVATAFSGTVTVTATPSPTGGSVAATAGVATFRALSFADYGYREALTATAMGLTSIVSADFDIVQSLVLCAAGQICTTPTLSDTAGTTLASITADTGPQADQLSATVKGNPVAQYGSCGQPATGTTEQALGSVVTFNVTSRTKTVTMTLPRAYVNLIPNNGTPFMDICLDVPSHPFTNKFGQMTLTGLLPDCGGILVTTCITSRGKRAGDELITFILPAGDPHASWY